jgi:DNA-binding transcriptional LysR family regulator
MNITFRQLQVFPRWRQGSVQRAAEALHLTPPAVSMQIKELESRSAAAVRPPGPAR